MDKISWSDVYDTSQWVSITDNVEADKNFLEKCLRHFNELNFPNMKAVIEEVEIGKSFFSSKSERALIISLDSKKFKSIKTYIRATLFGKVLVTALYKTVGGFKFGQLDSYQKIENIKNSCADLAQFEEFIAIKSISELIFDNAKI